MQDLTPISSPWLLLGIGAVAASALMVVLWVVEVRISDATHVDVGFQNWPMYRCLGPAFCW